MLYDPSMKPAGWVNTAMELLDFLLICVSRHVFTEEDEPNIHLGAKPAPMCCQLRVIEAMRSYVFQLAMIPCCWSRSNC